MADQIDSLGPAAMFLVARLIERLVNQDILSVAAAEELVDQALLDAEGSLGRLPQGAPVRALLEGLLSDVRRGKSG